MTELLVELQRANALQIRVDRGKDSSESSVIVFPPVRENSEVAARIGEIRRILNLSPQAGGYGVRYGGYSGKSDEIAMVTRSMLQIMIEMGYFAEVPEADISGGKATPGLAVGGPAGGTQPSLLTIHGGSSPPADSHVAVAYKGRWFWIADNDVRSKSIFASIMLLFSISDVGVRSPPPVVTVPAN